MAIHGAHSCAVRLSSREKKEGKKREKREKESIKEREKECERAISVKLAKMNPPSTRDNTPQRRLDELKGQKRGNNMLLHFCREGESERARREGERARKGGERAKERAKRLELRALSLLSTS